MTTEQVAREFCRTALSYLPRDGGAPGQVEVSILDARTASLPGWEECGFELRATCVFL